MDDLRPPEAIVDAATKVLLGREIRIFQGMRLAKTEAGHVLALLRFMHPDFGSHILDLGCGVGEVARIMAEARPDLRFTLVNCNALQLQHAPPGMPTICSDYHAIPLPDGAADGAMFLWSIGHADMPAALAEAARLVRLGGFLFVFDFERQGGNPALLAERLCYRCFTYDAMRELANDAGWHISEWHRPKCDDAVFRSVYDDPGEYCALFDGLVPCAWRAERYA
jgi:ubiquinone/menaquinone biosynthesis C-methylase UbiE